ncbi:MAG: TonB-dependent receptor [Alphaproteobacteria bacterium]
MRQRRAFASSLSVLTVGAVASLGLLLTMSAASAQDDATTGDNTTSAQGPTLETIYSTARKREERLIDTPVAATALPKQVLERYAITSFEKLNTALPGVEINRASGGGSGGNFVIRGIGRQASDYGAEQPVALVVDGFSFTRGHATNMAFFDVETVEVLKGPQTLFFGKNSPAGVISVTTVTPGNEFEGFARASYEFRTENPTIEFGVSMPVVEDKLAIRIAGRGEFMQGGFLKYSTDPTINRDLTPFETDALYPSKGPHTKKFPGQKQFVGRLTAVFTPTDSFDATFKLHVSRTRQNDAGSTVLYACADGPGTNPYLSTAFFGLVKDTGQTCPDKLGKVKLERPTAVQPDAIHAANPTVNDRPNEYFQRTRNILATLEMNWDLGDIVLTSVTGFWDYNQDEYTNYDYTSFAVVSSLQGESGQSWTTEFRVQSEYDSPVNFMLGFFYEDMQRDLRAPVQIFPLGPAPAIPEIPSFYQGSFFTYDHFWDNWIESYSVFGELTWQITDNLEFSGGVRYTDEKRNTEGTQFFNRLDTFFPNDFGLPAGASPFAPTGSMAFLERKFDDVSPQATLSWNPTDDTLVYVAYKTGYQAAGTSNPGTFTNFFNCLGGACPFSEEAINDALTFDGSDVEGFEIGVKGQFLGGRLRADLTAFRYIYSGLQVAIFNSDTTTFTIQNAAKAVNQGFEGSFDFAATDNLTLRGAFQLLELKYKDYRNAQCYAGQENPSASNFTPERTAFCVPNPDVVQDVPDVNPFPGVPCHIDLGLNCIQDMSGEKYGIGPIQLQFGFTWDQPVGNGDWYMSFSGDMIWKQKGKEFLRQPNTAVPSSIVVDFAARLYQPDSAWEFALVCSNCFNEKYVRSIQDKPLQKIGDLTAQIALPRLITLQATWRFN